MPLSLRPQPVGICPVKDCPHFLVGVLDGSACEAKASKTVELMVSFGDFCRLVLDAMDFINYDT